MVRVGLLVAVCVIVAALLLWPDEAAKAPQVEPGADPTKRPPVPGLVAGGPAAVENDQAARSPVRVRQSPVARVPKRIEGLVQDEAGAPVPDVAIRYRGPDGDRNIRSSADGFFAIEAVGRSVRLDVDAPDPFMDETVSVRLARDSVTIRLERRPTVHVLVVDAAGVAVSGARLSVVGDTRGHRRATTDARGSVTLEGLKAGKEFALFVKPKEPGLLATIAGPYLSEQHRIEVELPAAHYLEGEVRTAKGEPAEGAYLSSEQGNYNNCATRTESRGRFRLGPLPAGPCDIQVAPAAGEPVVRLKVSVPAAPLRVALLPHTAFECPIELAEGAKITRSDWIVDGNRQEIRVSRDGRLYGSHVADRKGTLFVCDDQGRCALFRDTRLADIPSPIVLVPGAKITGLLDNDDAARVSLRLGKVTIYGTVSSEELDDEPDVYPFTIVVPPGIEGTLQVVVRGHVYHSQPARAGQRDIRMRVRTPD